jgi:uncharacterized Zn finger protein
MLEDQIFCPSCGKDKDHIIIKSGRENLVQCSECGTIHSIQKQRERHINVKVIVNKGETALPYYINIPKQEELRVGGELLVDDKSKDVVLTEITSIETDRRVVRATAGEVVTIWARAIDEVTVKISVYNNGISRPFNISTSGDDTFERGEIMEIDDVKFQIIKIKLRKEGFVDKAKAKDIVRIWGREL